MIKIDWDSWLKNRVWFGWLWRPGWVQHENGCTPTLDLSEGVWRRISTRLRFVPMQLAWRWRGGYKRG